MGRAMPNLFNAKQVLLTQILRRRMVASTAIHKIIVVKTIQAPPAEVRS